MYPLSSSDSPNSTTLFSELAKIFKALIPEKGELYLDMPIIIRSFIVANHLPDHWELNLPILTGFNVYLGHFIKGELQVLGTYIVHPHKILTAQEIGDLSELGG